MLAIGFFVDALYQVEKVPILSLRYLHLDKCWILSFFSYVYLDLHMFFLSKSHKYVELHFDWFCVLNQCFIPMINPIFSWIKHMFHIFLFLNFCLEFLQLCSQRVLELYFLLFFWLWYQGNTDFIELIGSFLLSSRRVLHSC